MKGLLKVMHLERGQSCDQNPGLDVSPLLRQVKRIRPKAEQDLAKVTQ